MSRHRRKRGDLVEDLATEQAGGQIGQQARCWDLIAALEAPDLRAFDDVLRQIRLVDGVNLTDSNILLSSRKSAPI